MLQQPQHWQPPLQSMPPKTVPAQDSAAAKEILGPWTAATGDWQHEKA